MKFDKVAFSTVTAISVVYMFIGGSNWPFMACVFCATVLALIDKIGLATDALMEANHRAIKNEDLLKQLTEAGRKLELKVQDMDNKMVLDGVGRFAGVKR